MNRKPLYIDIDTGDILASDIVAQSNNSASIKGQKGDIGLMGPAGYTGTTGLPGPKGDIGSAGPVGSVGSPGSKGDIGEKGDKGNQGPQGTIGLPGLKGESGNDGLPGVKGDIGPVGITGASGNDGLPGVKGDIGLTGLNGIPGIKGQKGDGGGGQSVSLLSTLSIVQENITTISDGNTITDIPWQQKDDVLILPKQNSINSISFVITNGYDLGLMGQHIQFDVYADGSPIPIFYLSYCNINSLLDITPPIPLTLLHNAFSIADNTTQSFTVQIKSNLTAADGIKITTFCNNVCDITITQIQTITPAATEPTIPLPFTSTYQYTESNNSGKLMTLYGNGISAKPINGAFPSLYIAYDADAESLADQHTPQLYQPYKIIDGGIELSKLRLLAIDKDIAIVLVVRPSTNNTNESFVSLVPYRTNSAVRNIQGWKYSQPAVVGVDVGLISISPSELTNKCAALVIKTGQVLIVSPAQVIIITYQNTTSYKIRKLILPQLPTNYFNIDGIATTLHYVTQTVPHIAIHTESHWGGLAISIADANDIVVGILELTFNTNTGEITQHYFQMRPNTNTSSIHGSALSQASLTPEHFELQFFDKYSAFVTYKQLWMAYNQPNDLVDNFIKNDWARIGYRDIGVTSSWDKSTTYTGSLGNNTTNISTMISDTLYELSLVDNNTPQDYIEGGGISYYIQQSATNSYFSTENPIQSNMRIIGRQPSSILADGKYPALTPVIDLDTQTIIQFYQRCPIIENDIELSEFSICAIDYTCPMKVDDVVYPGYGAVICKEPHDHTINQFVNRIIISDFYVDAVMDQANWMNRLPQTVGTNIALIDCGTDYNIVDVMVIYPGLCLIIDQPSPNLPSIRTTNIYKFIKYTSFTEYTIHEVVADLTKMGGNLPNKIVYNDELIFPISFTGELPKVAIDQETGEVCITTHANTIPGFYKCEVNIKINPVTFTIVDSYLLIAPLFNSPDNTSTNALMLINNNTNTKIISIEDDGILSNMVTSQQGKKIKLSQPNFVPFPSSNNNIYWTTYDDRVLITNPTSNFHTTQYNNQSGELSLNFAPLIGAKLIEQGVPVDNPTTGCPLGDYSVIYY